MIESAGEESGKRHEELPRIALARSIGYGRDLPLSSRIAWYAGAIVHQAWHSKLYREHRLQNPDAPWPSDKRSARQREDACLHVQHDALLRMGAPPWMLDYVKGGIGMGSQEADEEAW